MSSVQALSSYDNHGLRQINLGDGVSAGDGVNKSQLDTATSALQTYVDTQLASTVSGLTPKGAVRVAVSDNVNLAAPGANLDGAAMSVGDRFLAYGQSTGTENGPYVWNGAAVAATRAPNWDTNAEAVVGSHWMVLEGTKADTIALLTNDTFSLGSSTAMFGFVGLTGSGGTPYYTETCPFTAAGGTWQVIHNLGTRLIHAQVARSAAPYDFVRVRMERTTINTLDVLPDIELAPGEYEVIIKKVGS